MESSSDNGAMSSSFLLERRTGLPPSAFASYYQHGVFADARLSGSVPPGEAPPVRGHDLVVHCHRVVLSAVSAPLRRRFVQQPDPSAVVRVDGVRHNALVSVLDLVYHGRVRVRREEREEFCAAMRALAIRLGDERIDRMVYEEDFGEDPLSPFQGGIGKRVECRPLKQEQPDRVLPVAPPPPILSGRDSSGTEDRKKINIPNHPAPNPTTTSSLSVVPVSSSSHEAPPPIIKMDPAAPLSSSLPPLGVPPPNLNAARSSSFSSSLEEPSERLQVSLNPSGHRQVVNNQFRDNFQGSSGGVGGGDFVVRGARDEAAAVQSAIKALSGGFGGGGGGPPLSTPPPNGGGPGFLSQPPPTLAPFLDPSQPFRNFGGGGMEDFTPRFSSVGDGSGPPPAKQSRPSGPSIIPSAVEGLQGLFWLELRHLTDTTVHAVSDKYGESGLLCKLVGSLARDCSAYLAYKSRSAAQHTLDKVLGLEPGLRLRPVANVPQRSLDFVYFDKTSSSGPSSSFAVPPPAANKRPKVYKVVFGNLPETIKQVDLARDLIRNGFRTFDKSSLTASNG